VADKLTQLITEALTKAAAEPAGLSLYAGKAERGLFSSTGAGKSAAQKCLSEGLIQLLASYHNGKSFRELYGLTEAGWNYLLAQVNPKQVLEDFVRVLEARRGEVAELLESAQRMADNLQGLKEAAIRVLPAVVAGKVLRFESRFETTDSRSAENSTPTPPRASPRPPQTSPQDGAGEGSGEIGLGCQSAVGISPPPERSVGFAKAILAFLREWSGAAGEDCPLPRLYRALERLGPLPTIGEFHDCLRRLHSNGALYLHPWTGPLYALPEPAFALLAGHNVAYYAAARDSTSPSQPQ
jgi:hypothetical protein